MPFSLWKGVAEDCEEILRAVIVSLRMYLQLGQLTLF